ncbi:MAG TPA: ABC transporter substrate-binding protein [Candidatus Tectomicrobia bacterium]|nr:ABC transporter substrate-binding protein [Candidatus Tectomicrobia bacterium]
MSARRRAERSPSFSLIAIALLLTLAAVATTATSAGALDASTYRRPLGNDPGTLDPARISDVYGRSVAQQIFDGLVRFDQTLAITPALAKFWRASRDGRTWTFELRRGVRFHHGREVTADDVVFSFTRILDPALRSSAAETFMAIVGAREFREGRAPDVAGLAAIDRYTVRIQLVEAFAPFVSVLAMGHATIVPRDLVERLEEEFGRQPVGTGPFRFAGWHRGRSITLEANDDYFDGRPRLSRLVYRIFPGEDSVGMLREFERGELEDSQVPTAEHARVVAGTRHVYVRRPMFNLRFYGFNTRVKPLDDRRVRQAIVHAIHRDAIVKDIFGGRFTPAHGVLPPGTLGFNPAIAPRPWDPERARTLLAEAGYPGGRGLPAIPFWSAARSERLVREHRRIVDDLAAIGIRAEFHYLIDWPAFSRMLADGRAPAFQYAWYADVPDPDNFLHLLFHSRSPRNYTRYANSVVDGLLAAARAEPQLKRRVELYRRAELTILDDAPIVPMWHYAYERVFQPYVRSVEVNGLGDPYIPLRKIWLDTARDHQ